MHLESLCIFSLINKKKSFFVIVSVFFLMVSCNKSTSPPTPQDYLVAHKWYFDSVTVHSKYDSTQTACRVNCYLTFSKDGTGHQYYGSSPCGLGSIFAQDFQYSLQDVSYGHLLYATNISIDGHVDSVFDTYLFWITDSTLHMNCEVVGYTHGYFFKAK